MSIFQIDICYKNAESKENILDSKDLESKQKISEEWNMKAKKRYFEAIKKNRQKEVKRNFEINLKIIIIIFL